jgi:hypothetical protein
LPFIPLIPNTHCAKLRRKRKDMMAAGFPGLANPFVAIGAEPSAAPRILFVGQATRGYGGPEQASFKKAIKSNIALLTAVRPSPFQTFIKDVTLGVLRGLKIPQPHDEQAVLQSIGWSNLAKIGYSAKANPTRRMLRHQADLCASTLRMEIETWDPHAVVFVTSEYAQEEILLPTFGRAGWRTRSDTDHVEFKKDAGNDRPLIWTNYPIRTSLAIVEEMRNGTIKQVLKMLSPYRWLARPCSRRNGSLPKKLVRPWTQLTDVEPSPVRSGEC